MSFFPPVERFELARQYKKSSIKKCMKLWHIRFEESSAMAQEESKLKVQCMRSGAARSRLQATPW